MKKNDCKRGKNFFRRTSAIMAILAILSMEMTAGEISHANPEKNENGTAYGVAAEKMVEIVNEAVTSAKEEFLAEQAKIVNVVSAEPRQMYTIECTAYEPTGNRCADGTWPAEGETLAGKREWLGRRCKLYHTDGTYIGEFTFHDTGFGHDPDGDGIGSIQDGSRIDYYMDSVQACNQWGVRDVLIEFLD